MIGLIYIGDLKYCPYLNIYTDVLKKINKDYEVLYWSREQEDSNNSKHIPFKYYSELSEPLSRKVIGLYKFRKWVINKIKEKKYDKLVILSTLTGIIIPDILLGKYKEKYIFDIRDYSYEHITLFKQLETKIINNSFFTGISSEAFINFLPKSNKYHIIHNSTVKEMIPDRFNVKNKLPLNVVWMGSVRYFNHQKKIIDHLANDKRFKMIYHGNGPELNKYKEYVSSKKISNVVFTGEYDNTNKSDMLSSADILNNSYHTEKEMETRYAISNKFYDGIFYKIPQLVETDTFKGHLGEEFGIGFSLDPKSANFSDDLYKRYTSLSENTFNQNIGKLADKIKSENYKYNEQIEQFIVK